MTSFVYRSLQVFFFSAIVAGVVFSNYVLYWGPLKLGSSSSKSFKIAGQNSGVVFGVTIDWERGDTPAEFNVRLGRKVAVFSFFLSVEADIKKIAEFKYVVEKVAQIDGAVLALTLAPGSGLEALTTGSLAQVAATMALVNQLGVTVLLRFGHEMNGNWNEWGQRPSQYVAAFKKLAAAVRAATARTFMVWAPNVGTNYPWSGARAVSQLAARDAALLDTNRDGVLSELDDPYTPYYPGDEWVDYVGLSLYHFGDPSKKKNVVAPDGYFEAALTGKLSSKYDFYDMFSVQRGKPLAIFETAAAYYPGAAGASGDEELAAQRAWWRQLLSSDGIRRRERLKLVLWFDVNKFEPGPAASPQQQVYTHFGITHDERIARAFVSDMPRQVLFGDSAAAEYF